MSNRRTKRIFNEIKELQDSNSILEQSGIYFSFDESNINIIYAMLIGQVGTPYEKGFYFFKFEYPESYPMQPPLTKYFTQGSLNEYNIRFNPNLYVNGKVCLSMLNTWTGPGWVPTNTISNVLVSIQALVLNDFPLINEPGYDSSSIKELTKYNEIISYANIKISVLKMLNNPPDEFFIFKDKISEIFMENIDYYKKFILTKNDTMNDVLIISPAYGMRIKLDYSSLYKEMITAEEFALNNIFLKKIDINS
jgi:ubiquitin-protein ligase